MAAYLSLTITNTDALNPITLPASLGGYTIAPSGNKVAIIDINSLQINHLNGIPDYVRAIQQLEDEGAITVVIASSEQSAVLTTADKILAAAQTAALVNGDTGIKTGTVAFAASTTETVDFATEWPDASFVVMVTPDSALGAGVNPYVDAKLVSGFDITFEAAYTGNVDWVAIRL